MLIGAAHGFLLGFTLFSIRHGNRTANRILALALILFALAMALHTLLYSKYILLVPHLSKIEPLVMLLIGPLFYFCVKALTQGQLKSDRKHLLHALPAILCLLSLVPFYLLPTEEKIRHLTIDLQGPCKHCFFIAWLVIMQMFAYLIASIRELILHARRIKESYSSIEKISLKWLQRLKDLTLNSLAEKLSIPSHHLSQIINESLRQNFFEFVNTHRVEEAKKLLLDPANRHLNLAEIGYEAGFNSVSSFNAVFKKFVQMTPSRYQKNRREP
jgi:AraC-like DNA-binding protein